MSSLKQRLALLLRLATTSTPGTPTSSSTSTAPSPATSTSTGLADTYAPEVDGEPDPGEIVWAWVAYEDDPSQGKDRPVLVLRAEGDGWIGLYLSSQDHDRDAADEARFGRFWMDIGTGAWDSQGRPSEVRLDRQIPLTRAGVRREGAALDASTFARVVEAAGRYAGQ